MNTKVKKKSGYSKKLSSSSKGNMMPGYTSHSKNTSKRIDLEALTQRILRRECASQEPETENKETKETRVRMRT
jgi:hypothetical protein